MTQDVFKIDEVVHIATHRWLVRGRAWQTFGVEDKIYAAVGRFYKSVLENDRAYSILIDPGIVTLNQPFTVVSISTYGRNMSALDRGLTGEVILEGEEVEILKENMLLVKP